jgi:predicted hotdog family 3-hydroxylacyl-ACP dehydratase
MAGVTTPAMTPTQLDHARIPHRGPMCLLARMTSWSHDRIECVATNQGATDHPLRTRLGLLATASVEYAAQAMALHGALLASAAGTEASPGFLASARDVRLQAWQLDDLGGELVVTAERQAADGGRLLYGFTIHNGGREIASGRVAVVLNAIAANTVASP